MGFRIASGIASNINSMKRSLQMTVTPKWYFSIRDMMLKHTQTLEVGGFPSEDKLRRDGCEGGRENPHFC